MNFDPKGEAGARKTPLHLLPPPALAQTAEALRNGAEKYGAFNWRENNIKASTYVAAMMRHIQAWWDGEDLDPESGISHIAHVAASAMIVMDAANQGTLEMDRPPNTKHTYDVSGGVSFRERLGALLKDLEAGARLHAEMAQAALCEKDIQKNMDHSARCFGFNCSIAALKERFPEISQPTEA